MVYYTRTQRQFKTPNPSKPLTLSLLYPDLDTGVEVHTDVLTSPHVDLALLVSIVPDTPFDEEVEGSPTAPNDVTQPLVHESCEDRLIGPRHEEFWDPVRSRWNLQ